MKTDGIYYFNRCRKCQTLLTKLQVLAAFQKDGHLCPCGAITFGPSNPLWYEWLLPRVQKMVFFKLMGWLAPAPEPERAARPLAAAVLPVPPLNPEEIPPPEDAE
jgi:hypothetical protein